MRDVTKPLVSAGQGEGDGGGEGDGDDGGEGAYEEQLSHHNSHGDGGKCVLWLNPEFQL